MALIDWVRCIHSDGWHNAFTDLQWFKGKYYVCFRNGLSHVSPEGKVVVIASDDLYRWERVGVPVNTTGDDRDPHLIVAEDRLYVIVGTSSWSEAMPEVGKENRYVRTYCSYTDDGINWSKPQQIYEDHYWVWGVGYADGIFYGLAYGGDGKLADAATHLHLVRSNDALDWEKVSQVSPDGSEATFRMAEDGTMRVAIRDKKETRLSIATAKPPFEDWQLTDVDKIIPAPKLIQVGGQEYIIGRHHLPDPNNPGSYIDRRTSVWRLEDYKLEHVLDLPSSGDTSYVGVIIQEDESVLLSYYSQHEVKYSAEHWICPANIYLAQIRL